MRLAILQQSYGRFGGAERLAFSHFVQLKRMNVDVTLFYEGRISPGWKMRLDNEKIRRIPTRVANKPEQFRGLMSFLAELKGFDKIIIHHHIEPILAFYLSKFLGDRIVWYSGSVFELPWEEIITGEDYRRISPTVRRTGGEFYGNLLSKLLLSDPMYGLTARTAKVVDIATVRSFGKVLANSLFLANSLKNIYGLKDTPDVVYPGADPLLAELASSSDTKEQDYMLAVGSLTPLKNMESLIIAAAGVQSSKIVSVGDGQDQRRLKNLGLELDVPIEFKGTVDREEELARVYGGCKFLVHLSLYEPFGLTPVEAGLFSKPSIVTNRGGPAEVIVDGMTGYVVNPLDHRFIRSKMDRLLADDSLRREMGRRARENVVRRFTLERSTSRLIEELEE